MNNSTLLVRVQKPHPTKSGEFQELYRNNLEFPQDSDLPFTALYHGLKLLYPNPDVIISFIVNY